MTPAANGPAARSIPARPGLPLAVLGGTLVALTMAGLMAHRPGAADPGSELRLWVVTGLGGASALVYLAAVSRVLRGVRSRRALLLVLAVAALLRAPLLAAPPFLSSDLYRYIWDGRVQAQGINPYRYLPADPALQGLRDAAIYPGINRPDTAPTIYPPVAQILFAAIARVSQTPFAIKAAMTAFEALAIVVMLALLRRAALDPARILIYAWNPVAVWEFSGNGHIDAAAIGFLALALLAWAGGRRALVGLALGAAVLTKFLPLVVAPALWRRWDWRMPAAMAALAAALYLCYASVGLRVFGYLPGYASEEGLGEGGGIFWLALLSRVATLPPHAGQIWLAAGALALLALGARQAFGPPARDVVDAARRVSVMATALGVVITPHYPWYFAWAALPACLAPSASVIWLASVSFIQYVGRYSDRILVPSLIYVPFLVLAARDLLARPQRDTPALPAAVPGRS